MSCEVGKERSSWLNHSDQCKKAQQSFDDGQGPDDVRRIQPGLPDREKLIMVRVWSETRI